jgi:hypothetical protein
MVSTVTNLLSNKKEINHKNNPNTGGKGYVTCTMEPLT